jgi:hypothetical protein
MMLVRFVPAADGAFSPARTAVNGEYNCYVRVTDEDDARTEDAKPVAEDYAKGAARNTPEASDYCARETDIPGL